MKAVVWKVNGLGDFVTFLPTLERLINFHGIENILFILSPISLEVLKTFHTPVHYILISRNELISLYKHPFKLLSLSQKIKKFSAGRAYFTFDECSSAYIASFLARIPERIGYDSKISAAQRLLTKKIKFDANKNVYSIHSDLLDQDAFFSTSAEENNFEYKSTLKSPFPGHPYIVIHPFAQFAYREWDLKKYMELAEMIEQKMNIRTLMIGEEKHRKHFQGYKYAYSLNNSINALFSLIKASALYIGNNSGPLHIAILMGTPFISIEGPSASNWGPHSTLVKYVRLRNNNINCAPCESIFKVPMKCINQVAPNCCLKSITVHQVFNQVNQLLETVS